MSNSPNVLHATHAPTDNKIHNLGLTNQPHDPMDEEAKRLEKHMLTVKAAEQEKARVEKLKTKIHDYERSHPNDPLAQSHKEELVESLSPRYKNM